MLFDHLLHRLHAANDTGSPPHTNTKTLQNNVHNIQLNCKPI